MVKLKHSWLWSVEKMNEEYAYGNIQYFCVRKDVETQCKKIFFKKHKTRDKIYYLNLYTLLFIFDYNLTSKKIAK